MKRASTNGARRHDPEFLMKNVAKCQHIYVAPTARCGFGIFAARPFRAGESLVVDEDGDYYNGAITGNQALTLGYDISQHCFQIGEDLYLPPTGSIDDFINHCCDPNAGIRLTERGYRLIALRHIACGAEITYDYSTYIMGCREMLACHCGSPRCRGIVGPFVELPEGLQRRYLELGVVGAFALPNAVAA